MADNELNTVNLNPRAISFVEDYMEKFGSNLGKMKTWGRPYFDIMNNILTQHGLPTELKYLSVIESALKTYAVSWAGAVGPWQFMPDTARNLGLKVLPSGLTNVPIIIKALMLLPVPYGTIWYVWRLAPRDCCLQWWPG